MLAAFPPTIRWSGRPRKRIALSELAEESFILYRRHNGPGLYDAVISACAAAGFSPRMAQEAPRMLSTLSLVAAGLGVSLVPASLRRVNIEGVVYVNVTQPAGPRAPLNLIWRDAPVRRLPQADRGSAALPRPAARLTPGGATLCGCRILSRIFMPSPQPIGVYDSGLGGLSVARAIRDALPGERLLYVADSAHVPYGEKPRITCGDAQKPSRTTSSSATPKPSWWPATRPRPRPSPTCARATPA